MLSKLWNSIRGKSPSDGARSSSRRAKPTSETGETRKLAKPTTPGRGLLGRGGPHAALCRLIKKTDAQSILEIGVGDGSRAEAVLRTLQKSRPESTIQYTAIDQFEMAGGPVSLKQFHQHIRSLDIKPNLVPMPIQQGLARVAHTLGVVDLVLVDHADLEAARPMLSRITQSSSVIFLNNGQSWQTFPIDELAKNPQAA